MRIENSSADQLLANLVWACHCFKSSPTRSALQCVYPRACCNLSRKNVLSLSKVWLVLMPMNSLAFETLPSVPPGNFNFIRLKRDRMGRRSKCSDKPSPFAAKSEFLTARRSADRLRFNAAYLAVFTLNNVKHLVCRSSG